ncbi:MAG: IS4 family transposase [Rhodanobacter sp.]
MHRERRFPPTTTLAMFMAQTLNPDASCQATIDRHAVERIANELRPCSTATDAYCKARQRLPAATVQALLRHTGTLLASQSLNAWRWRGRAVKLVDGTIVTMPDTAQNHARYPQSRTQKPGLGSPISRVVALMCLGTGAVLDAAMGPHAAKQSSEHALFHTLLGSVVEGDVLLGDRYYCSYVMIALLQARGADVVFQLHQRRMTDFRKGQRIGTMDHVVVWNKPKVKPHWLNQEGFEAIPETLRMRETDVGNKVLVSTVLSSTKASAQELKTLYAQRWNVELDLRHIKTTLGLERMTCKTPAMNEKQW